jgi:hypothetical protein
MLDLSNVAEWFTHEPGSTAWFVWIRLAANLTIVAAIASVVCSLYGLSRRHAAGQSAPRWLVVLFAVGIALCGICHLGRAFGFGPPPDLRPGPTLMRIAIALFWVVVAVRLPVVVAQLTGPLATHRVCSMDHRVFNELADLTDQLKTRVFTLDNVILNQPRPRNLADAMTPLEEILADRETDHCPT